MRALASKLDVSIDAFDTIHQIKQTPSLAKQHDIPELFSRYLDQIERVLDQIDAHSQA